MNAQRLNLDDPTEFSVGVDDEVTRVIVIGAGASGLAAANALTAAGVETVVLEARERIGGRLDTRLVAGSPIDCGGSWIHQPEGNPMARWAEFAGVRVLSGNPEDSLYHVDVTERRRLSDDESALVDELAEGGLEDYLVSLLPLEQDRSIAAVVDDYIGTLEVDPAVAQRAHQAILGNFETGYTDVIANVSVKSLLRESVYGGPKLGLVPKGGYRALLEPLARGLDIRLGWEVRSVEHSEDGVVVTSADGRVERGSHVVVTLPFGVLKAGVVRFDPPLSEARQRVIDALDISSIEKVGLAFETPFWRESGTTMVLAYPEEPERARWFFIDFDHEASPPTIALLVPAGDVDEYVASRTEEEAIEWARGLLSVATGVDVPEPLGAVVTGWRSDPFARGCCTHVPPGVEDRVVDTLGIPEGRLHFAGEHTQLARLGDADGALISGLREARRLLGTKDAGLAVLGADHG